MARPRRSNLSRRSRYASTAATRETGRLAERNRRANNRDQQKVDNGTGVGGGGWKHPASQDVITSLSGQYICCRLQRPGVFNRSWNRRTEITFTGLCLVEASCVIGVPILVFLIGALGRNK